MATYGMHENGYRRELGDGLVLRWSTATDRDGLTQLYTQVFRSKENEPPSQGMSNWLSDMMSGRHPLITPDDFALVEDTERQLIVAATCLLGQPVDFGGISMKMGRPEVVATLPDYRNRGLIRSIFDLIHARSDARGDDFQGITGIGYYYRQFGYEYASPLDGGRVVAFADIPKLKEGETERYTLRDATLADLPVLRTTYERERTFPRRYTAQHQPTTPLVTTAVPEDYFRWILEGMNQLSSDSWRTLMIVNSDGQAVGHVLRFPLRWGETLGIRGVMVQPGVSLVEVLPSVLRALQALAPEVPPSRPNAPPPSKLDFRFFAAHPLYDALTEAVSPRHESSYAWYIRVRDVPGFVKKIAPVLESRLAGSIYEGYSGELRMDFYRGGLRLVFEGGRLTTAEPWRKPVWEPEPQAGFPPLSFNQLLFGYRSLAEMRAARPDVWADDDAARLIDVLFPAQPSWLLALE